MSKIKNKIKRVITKWISRGKAYLKTGKFIVVTPHRLQMLEIAMQYVKNEKVQGEYFEFGVARGLTFAGAYLLSRKYETQIRKFYAFDSFCGFPELGEIDREFERFKTGEESWSIVEFDETLKKADVDREQVEIVKGWFRDTLNSNLSTQLSDLNAKASIVWIDCDLYESSKQALNFIAPFLQNGSVVIFDDWYCYHSDPSKGEQRALAEFLSENSTIQFTQYRKFGIVGNSFIVTVT